MNSMTDQIQDLSEEDQEQYHRYVQRSLRRRWATAKDKIEREVDEINKRKC